MNFQGCRNFTTEDELYLANRNILVVFRNRGSKRKILEAVTDLALIGRGLAGTDYGAQTRGFH